MIHLCNWSILMRLFKIFRTIILIKLLFDIGYSSVDKQVIINDESRLVIKIISDVKTQADLFPQTFLIGLPNDKLPKIKITYRDESKTSLKTSGDQFFGFEWINTQKLKGLNTGTLKVSPMKKHGSYYSNILIEIIYGHKAKKYHPPHIKNINFLKNRVINWKVAKSWIVPRQNYQKKRLDFSDGRWFQFFIPEDGMNSIPHKTLSKVLDDVDEIDPRSFSVYMSSDQGRSKSQSFNVPIKENLVEIGISVEGETDSSFDAEDKIIFYGRGPSGFDYQSNTLVWNQNLYFISNSCWLFIPDDQSKRGKRIDSLNAPQTGVLIDYGLSLNHIEQDIINLDGTGTEWVSNSISYASSQPIILDIKDYVPGSNIAIKSRFKGHSNSTSSSANHSISISLGSPSGEQIGSSLNWTGNSYREQDISLYNIDIVSGVNLFYINNLSNDNNSNPHLDYFELRYSRELHTDDQYEFYSPIVNQNVRFSFRGDIMEGFEIWYLAEISDPKFVEIDDGGYFNFTPTQDKGNKFAVFNRANVNTIEELHFKEDVQFNSLRNNFIQADYIIIGPETFRGSSTPLLDLRSPAIFASIEQIYFEFSGGNADPMGIRNFIQWTQENWQSPVPQYVLLLGDSGYDYRNITGQSSIIVPTIQVQSARKYATDDRLATLYGNIPEVALGRFPARNESEVINFIEKVISIETEPILGQWRQRVTLVADDPVRPEPNHGSINTGKSHTINSEQLYNIIPKSIITNKLYLIEYPETSDESVYGVSKPEATQDLFKYLNQGTAIITYIGHGSPYQLAQEKLLSYNRGDINKINTGRKLPLWIVGTCSFGYFDDPLSESFAEELIRADMNAAASVIATSRPITVVGNERYTLDIFESIFNERTVNDDGIGIILQSIKDGSNEGQYFHLFGDPALKIPMPKDTLISLSTEPDTLETLEIGLMNGTQNIISNEGEGFFILKDANMPITRDYEISNTTHSLSYILPGATLFRGQFTFSGSSISASYRIPEDISYSNEEGSIITYIYDEENEGIASYHDILLKGGKPTKDKNGPIIYFENINGQRFESGDHFPYNEILVIHLQDPLGINLTNETGHEITIKDFENLSVEIVTDNFFYNSNSITNGKILYPVDNKYINMSVKAWDNANNPSEKLIQLYRTESEKLKIYNVYNFPNPFSDGTDFVFEVNQDFDVELDIFSIGGKRIWSEDGYNLKSGVNIIKWNGVNAFGSQISNGVYIFRLKIIGNKTTLNYIGKCAKYR